MLLSENHFATVVMFHNITSVTYGLPVSKMLTTSSGVGVTTGKSIGTWAGYYRMSFDFEPRLTLPNALTCCIGRTATVTNRIRACLTTHSGYPLMRRNRTPRTAKDTCAICL